MEVDRRVAGGDNPGEESLRELEDEDYELVVLGGIDRGHDDRPYLGRTIRTVLSKTRVPAVLLVSRAA